MNDTVARFRAKARQDRFVRRRRRALRVGVGVAPLVGLVALLLSPALDVEEVRVVGTQRLPARQVAGAADVPAGRPLVLVDVDDVRRRVAALPYVRSATVRREWPRRVVIEVAERVPALAVPTGGAVALYDADGVRLGGARTVPRGVPLLRVAGGRPAPALVRAVVSVVASLPDDVRRDVLGYTATSPDDVTFALRGGREVVWGSRDDAAAKGEVLLVLLRRGGTRFDVRAPSAPAVR